MSGGAVIVGIEGTILADVADMRLAADAVLGVHTSYLRSLGEFHDLWNRGTGPEGIAAALPPIGDLGDRIEELATYLRSAADRYAEADRFAPVGLGEQVEGVASTAWSLSLTASLAVASGHWRAPRIDPRIGGRLTDAAMVAGDIVLGPRERPEALARERTARPQTTRVAGGDGTAPRSVEDLADRLARVGERGGNATVEIITSSDGARRAIVYLRGTSRWDIGSDDPLDVDGNIAALAGRPTVYGRGVVDAMRAAGIDPTTPVMLVGHSQGGMVAANLSRELAESGEFAVTDVVTFGSPFAQMDQPVPDGVQLTAFENRSDVVPALDGRRNSHAAGAVTVTFDDGERNMDAHHMEGYRAGAAALDTSVTVAARAVTARLRPFTSGSTSTTQSYRVRRQRS